MTMEHQRSQLPPTAGGAAHDQGQTLAQEINEVPERLTKRLDVSQVIEGMQRGVLVTLRISRPRFSVALAGKRKNSPEMPGLEKIGLVLSNEAQRVLSDYFTLGRHSMLPKRWQEELNTAETSARRCLADFTIKTHWGAFLSSGQYQRWKAANQRYEEQFWALKEQILAEYDQMRAEVQADYRRLAEDAWAHATFGRVALQAHNGAHSPAMAADLTQKLSEQEAHDQFIERYMAVIDAAIPSQEELADAFEYEAELSYIPLPAQLARERALADAQMRDQLLQEEAARAELEVIQARRDAELHAIQVEQTIAQDLASARRRNELAQLAMERDVIARAQAQKEELAAEFHDDVVEYINAKIAQTCGRTRESLEKNQGVLRGPVADSLRDLVVLMENLNFFEDEGLENQLAKLREVLPTQEQRERAGRGVARIDTSRIDAVVRQMEEQAEQTLLELDLSQAPRSRRAQPLTIDEQTLLTDAPRRTARSQPSALPVDLASSRRSRNKPKKA